MKMIKCVYTLSSCLVTYSQILTECLEQHRKFLVFSSARATQQRLGAVYERACAHIQRHSLPARFSFAKGEIIQLQYAVYLSHLFTYPRPIIFSRQTHRRAHHFLSPRSCPCRVSTLPLHVIFPSTPATARIQNTRVHVEFVPVCVV